MGEYFGSGIAAIGLVVFFAGMAINLHSDHVIRHLRKPGDTRHYLPKGGMYHFVTSGNYLGELIEWTGFAIIAGSPAAWVFVWWTAANLVSETRQLETEKESYRLFINPPLPPPRGRKKKSPLGEI